MPSLGDDAFGLPLAKRQKRSVDGNPEKKPRPSASKIFSPFRTLGLVSSTTVPFTSVRLGKSTFQITTSVGHVLQTYDLRRGLGLVFLSQPQTPETITASYAYRDKVFAAWGNFRTGSPGGVWVFKRGKKVASLAVPSGLAHPIEQLLVVGSWIICCSSRSIEVWKSGTYEHYTTLNPPHSRLAPGHPIYTGKMCNMPTFLNKIFAGRYDGNVDIWNLRTGKLLYSIPPVSANAGAVTALEPTPVLSLIAIAYKNGALSIQNVETDQSVLRLEQQASSPITSISFRTDDLGAGEDGNKPGVMATASLNSGDITLWDLNNGGRVAGVVRGAHSMTDQAGSGVTRVEFFDGQPLLVSSGMDNSLKTWIFDEAPFSPVPRPLHSREGHFAAVTTIGFLPTSSDGSESSGKWILSASKDRSLWGFSIRKDSQNTELSQGSVGRTAKKLGVPGKGGASSAGLADLKAPEITCVACSLNRDGGIGVTTSGPIWANSRAGNTDASNSTGWESVVTGHRGDKYARTWFWGKKRAGRWAFMTGDGTEVKSVAISQCGTFALVGSAGGNIDVFNMQSGLHRQSFPSKLSKSRNLKSKISTASREGEWKHTKEVTGLMINALNQTVVSCGLDGKVKFWDFISGFLVDELDWHPMTAVTGLRYNSASELVAFSCDDLSIRIVDIETRKVVREFWGCVGQVNDFAFSNDGRWLIAASMDSVIRVWDLPTGHLIDIFRVSSTCTTLAMSVTGDFLATAHADGVGINLWSNKSLFAPVSTKHVDESSIESIQSPTVSGESGIGPIESAFLESSEIEEPETEGPVLFAEQLTKDMVTLSGVPRNRWQTLLHLDVLKERNKPKDPPKPPEKAPFFLPSLSSEEHPRLGSESTKMQGDVGMESLMETTPAEVSRIAKSAEGKDSQVTSLLRAGHQNGNFDPLIEHLKSLSPGKADLEIRSLDPRVRDGHSELSDFVMALAGRLKLRRDFELVNAWMAVFLKINADTVSRCADPDADEHETLRDALNVWDHEQRREARRLTELVGYCRGIAGFLRSAR